MTDQLLGGAEDAVKRFMALGADCAEVFMAAGTSISVQVERDVVTYTTTDSEAGMGIRLVRDGRLGFAYTSDPSKVDEAGFRALSLSRLAPRTGYTLPSPGGPYPAVEGLYDPAVRTMEPSEAVAMAGEMVDAAKGVHPGVTVGGGGVGLGYGTSAIASSEGVSVATRGTSMSAWSYVVLRDADVSTGFEFGSSRLRDVDGRDVGEASARLALDAQGATPLERGGEMTVIFRPTAYAELLAQTLMPSFIGDAAQRGESAFTGREGQAVAAPTLGMVDDPLMPAGIASDASDDEGVPARRNALIDGGELVGFLYDSFHANLYGVGSTASASRGSWRSQPEADVSNVVVQVPSHGSLEDLVSGVDRGLVVHDVMGAHTANRQTLDFSVNSTMPFEVRNGEVVGVRRPAMLGGNLGDLLMRTLGGGGDARQVPEGGVNIVLPWIAVDGVTVTP